MAGWATKIEGNTINISVPYMPGAKFHAYTLREPVGVVGQIIPWNFPLLMAAWKLGPALATGYTVVLKPAEQTPLTALRLGELIAEAGMPDGVVNIVTGFGETAGAALAAHPMVDKVAFTGSTEVGRLIVQAAAGNLKKVTLELGGKSPNIVFADADLDAADRGRGERDLLQPRPVLRAPARGCSSQQSRFDEVVEGVAEIAKTIKLGPGIDADTQMGPLVSDEQLRRVTGYLESGRADGADGRHRRRTRRRPRLLRRADRVRQHPAGHEGRARGDLRPGRGRGAVPVDSTRSPPPPTTPTTGSARASGRRTSPRRTRMAKQLRAGTVWINCYNVFDAALPFGGYKQSGWGREMGHEVLEAYTEVKAVTAQL